MSSGTYTEPLNYATNFNVPLLIHIVVCSSGLNNEIMSDYKVGCSPLTSRIYAGKVLKNGTWGANKKDVTDSAVSAVAQQLLQTGEKLQFTYQGEQYELKVEKVS